jgi:hypothetical protein
MNGMDRNFAETLLRVLRQALGDQQEGERRARYIYVLPQFKDKHGKLVDNPRSYWSTAKDGKRTLLGGKEIVSGGEGQDCVTLYVGQINAIPDGKGGDKVINEFLENGERWREVIVFTAPTVEAKARQIAENPNVIHLNSEEHAELIKQDGGNLLDWKRRLEALTKPRRPKGQKPQKKAD